MAIEPPSDAEQATLRLLGVLHYVYAGLGGLGLLLLAGHYWLFQSALDPSRPEGPPPYFAGIFVAVYVALAGWLLLNIALNLIAGAGLRRRRHWVVVVTASAINTLQMPLGTLLGVFTLFTVLKAPVRASFR